MRAPSARLLACCLVSLTPGLAWSAPLAPAASSPELRLGPDDFRIEQRGDPGYHLFVRQKPGLASILLAESTTDPARKSDNYAFRDASFHEENGRERRMLNGIFLPLDANNHWLIDSRAEPDAKFGSAFHVFIPWLVLWGYPWSRSGTTITSDGTFINVRAFSKPFADYSGSFQDNPFLVRVRGKGPTPLPVAASPPPGVAAPTATVALAAAAAPGATTALPEAPVKASEALPPAKAVAPRPLPAEAVVLIPPTPRADKKPELGAYFPETVTAFGEIAEAGKGSLRYAMGTRDIVPLLASLLDPPKGRKLDLVLCIDSTDSMQDDIDALRKALPGEFKKALEGYSDYRIGLIFFKDYFEEYLVKRQDFTRDFAVLDDELAAARVGGGRDIPEAVHEALYAALTEYDWTAEDRRLVLIGDAPPHPLPRGTIGKVQVVAEADRWNFELDAIILPP
ncbi:MAG: vWA domain-containing protein [Spirochaetota bacterium]